MGSARSPLFSSAPLGPSRRRYANAAVVLRTALEPPALLARLKAIAAFVVIGVIGLFIIGFLCLAAAAGLGEVMPQWLALLIVAGVFTMLAVLAGVFGIARLKKPPLKPEKAQQTIKEDVEWAKAQLRR